ncbi:MAG TPA: pyridoxal-phosphate dependent enzyme [Nocardioidaceae bacterium]|nr:pyridoxal-phosphate dependent enzyme [Nocardioidaceae bacterium]
MADLPTNADIEAAYDRIRTVIRRTPLLELAADELGVPGRVLLKLELTQHTGSFKARGALNSVLSTGLSAGLSTGTPPGVAAVSGGNHGAAVAWAAQRAGISADVFVPSMATPEKLDRVRGYGATTHLVEGSMGTLFAEGLAWAEAHDVPLIHPFDQWGTVCGQGTVGLELAEQVPDADLVLVGCGGGGLYAGMAIGLTGHSKVQPVEPATCPSLHAALEAGSPVPVEVSGVGADSLGAPQAGDIAFEVARRADTTPILVGDQAIVEARQWLWQRCRLLAEPGASAALAALMTRKVQVAAGDTVVVVVSGGNNATFP